MANMSVNDVGSLLGNLNAVSQTQMVSKITNSISGGSTTKSTSDSFASMLSASSGNTSFGDMIDTNKTGGNPVENQKNDSDRIAGEEKSDAGKTSAADEKQDKETKVAKDGEDAVTSEKEITAKDIENAQETLGAATSLLLQQIMNTLDISPEELQGILDDMGITAGDLLDAGNLSAFALMAMGEEDSLSLLTNESQYEQFQNLTNALSDILSTEDEDLGLTVGEIREMFADVEATNGEDISSEVSTLATAEGATLGAETMLKSNKRGEAEADASNQQGGNATFAHNDFNPVQNVAPEIQATESYADTQEIANQILDYMRANVKPDMSTLEMQLHPASLGNIQISLTNKDGALTANFVAQNEQVKAALETQMIQLTERFEEQGIKVTSIEVSVATHNFEQNLEQNEHRQEQQEAERVRPARRRLQIVPGMDIEEIDVTNDDERIAAEMLAASGGTMDVQA